MMAGDITAPVTIAQVVPSTPSPSGYYTTSPQQVNLLVSDPDSPLGIATFYSIDNAAFVQGNAFLLGDGNHTIQFFSVDASGNREATHVQAVNIDSTVPVVTVSASPNTLFPPNRKFVPVRISGQVLDATGGIPQQVSYSIVDEYNPSRPISGVAPVDATGHYSFVVPLQASRLGQDKDGRHYSIIVAAADQAGNTGAAATLVVVPHDRGRHRGEDRPGHAAPGHVKHGNKRHHHPKPNHGHHKIAKGKFGKVAHGNNGHHGSSGKNNHGQNHGNGHGKGHGKA